MKRRKPKMTRIPDIEDVAIVTPTTEDKMKVDSEAIAQKLDPIEKSLLKAICAGQPLPHATRIQDRARQRLKKLGLVHVAKNPRRWEALPLGEEVRFKL